MKYEYGKEYECNGVKPDLPDDVLVELHYTSLDGSELGWSHATEKAGEVKWFMSYKFRIVDERYKPAPEQGWYDYYWIFYLVFIVAWMLFVALFAARAAG